MITAMHEQKIEDIGSAGRTRKIPVASEVDVIASMQNQIDHLNRVIDAVEIGELLPDATAYRKLVEQRDADADAMIQDLLDDHYENWQPGDEHFVKGFTLCNVGGNGFVAGDFDYENEHGKFRFSLTVRLPRRSLAPKLGYEVTALELSEPMPC